jgi:hypothetical protein
MATPYDACIKSAQAALAKLSDLETTAMKNGDLATVNALQSSGPGERFVVLAWLQMQK